MELAVAGENAMAARKRVRRNKGSPGIDGRTVEELAPYLREHWPRLREALLAGTGTYFERLGVPRLAAATSTH